MSISWQSGGTRPALLVVPPDAASLDEADAAVELWEHYSGKTADPSQRLAVQVMMAQRSDGRWAASTTGREMPRQNGKGDELEIVELWGLVQRGEAIAHTLHDAVMLATQSQQRLLAVLEGHGDLRRKIARTWRGTGQQMIEMRNGGIIWYRTRTGSGLRGIDGVDRVVVDEAQHATEDHIAAISPVLLANANGQLNAAGTAGLPGESKWWWEMRKRALSPDPGPFGYVGHTAEVVSLDDAGNVVQSIVDVEDRALWLAANPATAAGRGQGMEFLEEQFRRLGPTKFGQEHLCVWASPPGEVSGSPFDAEAWAELEGVEGERPSPVALAVELGEDRKWAHIGLAGRRADGAAQLEIVQSGRGTGWVADRVRELQRVWRPTATVVWRSGPAGGLVPLLEGAGCKVQLATNADYQRACGLFVDAFDEGRVAHAGQRQVAVALGAARKKWTRDRSGFVLVGSDDSVDIAPLRALVLALAALERAPKKKSAGIVYA